MLPPQDELVSAVRSLKRLNHGCAVCKEIASRLIDGIAKYDYLDRVNGRLSIRWQLARNRPVACLASRNQGRKPDQGKANERTRLDAGSHCYTIRRSTSVTTVRMIIIPAGMNFLVFA